MEKVLPHTSYYLSRIDKPLSCWFPRFTSLPHLFYIFIVLDIFLFPKKIPPFRRYFEKFTKNSQFTVIFACDLLNVSCLRLKIHVEDWTLQLSFSHRESSLSHIALSFLSLRGLAVFANLLQSPHFRGISSQMYVWTDVYLSCLLHDCGCTLQRYQWL